MSHTSCAPKHRACDECRSRKIACSKDRDGCVRCEKEGVQCHYSPQKPMGRPRKRRRDAEEQASPAAADDWHGDMGVGVGVGVPYLELPDLEADILGQMDTFCMTDGLFFDDDPSWLCSSDVQGHDLGVCDSLDQAAPAIACTCLSSVYFALNALQHLPSHIPSAIRAARHASKTAHQVISCTACYDVTTVDPGVPPPMQCFQNLMCLGTLVPSACNAYASILAMVDAEADRAKAEKRKMWLSLLEVGDQVPRCNGYIEPDMWRDAMRGVLRVDVHGREGSAYPLKGMLALLDEKKRRRDEVHGLAGRVEGSCMDILETARVALRELSIS